MPWPTTLATFMRTLAMPAVAELWSLTSLREKQSKIGREGRQPWPLRHPPDGRGRGATTDVPGNPVADHPVADTVRAGMRSAGPDATNDDGKRCASMQAKLRVFSASAQSTDWFDSCGARGARFTVAHDGPRRDPWPHNRAESGECRVHTFEPALLRNAQPRRYPIHANSSSISSPAAHTSRRVTWLLCMRSAKR